MLLGLNQMTQQLIADMLLLSELTRCADALETFYERWHTSMLCLSTALGKVGITLEVAAGNYETTDQWVGDLMKQEEAKLPPIPVSTGAVTLPIVPGQTTSPIITTNPGITYPPISPQNPILGSGYTPFTPTEGGFGIDTTPDNTNGN